METLGDGEELGHAVDHEPPGVDTAPARVGEQHLQHLGDTPTLGGGVDVPHRPALQDAVGRLGLGSQLRDPLVAEEDGRRV